MLHNLVLYLLNIVRIRELRVHVFVDPNPRKVKFLDPRQTKKYIFRPVTGRVQIQVLFTNIRELRLTFFVDPDPRIAGISP